MAWLYNRLALERMSEMASTTEPKRDHVDQMEMFSNQLWNKALDIATFYKVKHASLTCTLLKYLFSL